MATNLTIQLSSLIENQEKLHKIFEDAHTELDKTSKAQKLFRFIATNSDMTANGFDFVQVDSETSAITITLPPVPTENMNIKIKDLGFAGTNNITIDGNGNKIQGDDTKVLDNNYDFVSLIYFKNSSDDTKSQWILE